MTSNNPHFLLFSEASRNQRPLRTWRFVLQNVDTRDRFSATDCEPHDCGERLELLAVVRGLEALDHPARVTLVTKSRYVIRGIQKSLAEWRANDWHWERFGRLVPVRDHDLWRRVDQALRFHQVDCQAWQFEDAMVTSPTEPQLEQASPFAPPVPVRTPLKQPPCRPRRPAPANQGSLSRESVPRWQEVLRSLARPMRQAFAAMA